MNNSFTGKFNATVKLVDKNLLLGTGLEPQEKVFIIPETFKKEKGLVSIGVIRNTTDENNCLVCIRMNLLNLCTRAQQEIAEHQRHLAQ